MSHFQKQIEIPSENPFENCKLKREPYANILTDVITAYPDGIVLAIDNEWGQGKTTFIKMWAEKLSSKKHDVIYFNAWENDFEENPFMAIVSEIKTKIIHKKDANYKSFMEKSAKVSKAILPTILKGLAKKHLGDTYEDLIEKSTEGIIDAFEIEVSNYNKKKELIQNFKDELGKFIIERTENKPLIIFIDELDRCRPHYAVEVLENIKHLFSVEGITFVLSIDKKQLGHAICGYYGSDLINSTEYLRRFIDIEYSLPKPDTGSFVRYLFEKYDFDQYFVNRPKNDAADKEKEGFIDYSKWLFTSNELSLRQQERIFTNLRISLNTFKPNHLVLPELYVYLTVLKFLHPDKYNLIRNKKLKQEEILSLNYKFLTEKQQIPKDQVNRSIIIEATLFVFYNNYLDHHQMINTRDEKEILPFPKLTNMETFKHWIKSIEWDKSGVSLDYLFNKIELLDAIQKKNNPD